MGPRASWNGVYKISPSQGCIYRTIEKYIHNDNWLYLFEVLTVVLVTKWQITPHCLVVSDILKTFASSISIVQEP